jgi:dienelactone hydrolase
LSGPAVAAGEPGAALEQAVGDRLPGAFFSRPTGPGPFPALIVLGGSEGGDALARRFAPAFVEQGYAVLGLPYYSPDWSGRGSQFPQLPAAFFNIPVETVGNARDWLCRRSDVRCDAMGVYGVSKGAELALLAGSLIDGFQAIVAIVPSDVVWEGWGPGAEPGGGSSFSWRGEPLPFVPYVGMNEELAKFSDRAARPRLRLPHDRGRHGAPDRAVRARIAVERIDEPVLVAGGDADQTWNSGEMAQAVAERRAEAGLKTVALIFTDAGHGLAGNGDPGAGAFTEQDLAAQREIWPATLEFLRRHVQERDAGERER